MLADTFSRLWWMILLRGILAVLFGIAVLAKPGISLLSLSIVFGVFILADGCGNVVTAIGGRKEHDDWWVLLLAGLAGMALGLLTLVNPGITALALLFYIAVWAIAIGLLQLVTAFRIRKQIEGELWLGLGGLASVLFGMLLIARPGAGALAVLTLLGAYAIVFGVTLILLALKVRGFVKRAGTARRA